MTSRKSSSWDQISMSYPTRSNSELGSPHYSPKGRMLHPPLYFHYITALKIQQKSTNEFARDISKLVMNFTYVSPFKNAFNSSKNHKIKKLKIRENDYFYCWTFLYASCCFDGNNSQLQAIKYQRSCCTIWI